jgi:D-glycero-D-manno-heptose 1,7-bisphosphate phosphatase
MNSTPAVFLDKDGTLLEDIPFNVDPSLMRLEDGAAEGLRSLHQAGFRLIVISNQSGVALGRFPESALAAVEAQLERLLRDAGAALAGFYYCPHHPEGTTIDFVQECHCRKPRPGLIIRAAWEHGIALDRSWFVGDILDDIEAGQRAGCCTILINNGHETKWLRSDWRWPDYMVPNLEEAARIIGARDGLNGLEPSGVRAEEPNWPAPSG